MYRKLIKLFALKLLLFSSFYCSAGIINLKVEFEASGYSDLFGSQSFPFSSISGETIFAINRPNDPLDPSGTAIPTFLDLVIDSKIWTPSETLISYVFQNDELTHFTIGGVINDIDSPFLIRGFQDDFSFDRQGGSTGSSSVALSSLGAIFNTQNLSLTVSVIDVNAPTSFSLIILISIVFLSVKARLPKAGS